MACPKRANESGGGGAPKGQLSVLRVRVGKTLRHEAIYGYLHKMIPLYMPLKIQIIFGTFKNGICLLITEILTGHVKWNPIFSTQRSSVLEWPL